MADTVGEEVKEKPKKKKGGKKAPSTKKELKQRIGTLKSEKQKLLSGDDKKTLARVRKQIKRLKRLTKRAA